MIIFCITATYRYAPPHKLRILSWKDILKKKFNTTQKQIRTKNQNTINHFKSYWCSHNRSLVLSFSSFSRLRFDDLVAIRLCDPSGVWLDNLVDIRLDGPAGVRLNDLALVQSRMNEIGNENSTVSTCWSAGKWANECRFGVSSCPVITFSTKKHNHHWSWR